MIVIITSSSSGFKLGLSFFIFCILDHGETVIQRRMGGLVNFDQTWETYENGFGDLQGERTLSTNYSRLVH